MNYTFFLIEVELISNVVLISAVEQSDLVIRSFCTLFHYDLSQDIKYSSPCYTVGPCCPSILCNSLHLSSVQFSRSVVSDSLRPHELQHARPPCPSPTPGVHSDSSQSSQWCHPAMSFSVVPFSSCPQSLPASESFPMSHLFTWGGQSTGVSALASFLPKKSQGWSPNPKIPVHPSTFPPPWQPQVCSLWKMNHI